MAAEPKQLFHHYTLEDYFALEAAGEERYEYWDGEIVCMSGGTRWHAEISGNVYFNVRRLLRGRNCRAFTGEMSIKTPLLPPYRYPDAGVVCGEPDFDKIGGFDVLTNPVLIVEVLSSTTAKADWNEKRVAYQALPSLREYLIIAQDTPHLTQYVRDGGQWLRYEYTDLAAVIDLPSIQCRLALSDVYEGVEFE